jgi:cysteine desulfurase
MSEAVREVYAESLMQPVSNPSSLHRYGRYALSCVEDAKAQIAQLIDAQPEQIFFTSGATEANNWIIKGIAKAPSGTVATSPTEHDAVLSPVRYLQDQKTWTAKWIKVDEQGLVIPDSVPECDLLSVMWANNETGVINDLSLLAEQAHAKGGLIHTDAAQAAGKTPLSFAESGVDFMSLSAHKFGGPMGIGALVMKEPHAALTPLMHGGGHQNNSRSGTENVPAIIAFGAACEEAQAELMSRMAHHQVLRDHLEAQLSTLPGVVIFGQHAPRLSNTTFFAIEGISGEMAVMALDKSGFAVSGGAACGQHKDTQASHVLLAMGVPRGLAECAVRVSVGPQNTLEDMTKLFSSILDLQEQVASKGLRINT